jgi:23S rRNA (guanosine2251-2'-O)-methyltransferase
MDKKYGRSERRFNENDRNNQKKAHDNKVERKGAEENKGRKRYPRAKADRPYKNIDEYLSMRDEKYGETGDYHSDTFRAFNEGKIEGSRKSRRERQREDYKEKRRENRREIRQDYRREENREENPNQIEGRNAVQEAFRSGRSVDKIFVQEDLHDGPITSILRAAKKAKTMVHFVSKERLNQMSPGEKHQGVIAFVASYHYATVEDILEKAKNKGEDPFIFLLDGIEDPHNLGAIIRTANLAGAHGVIIGKHRAVGLTATVAKASAGALNYTPVAKVTNMANAIEQLKKDGMWFVCADMGGQSMYDLEMKGSVGIVIGNEGAGVSRLVKEKCDFIASIPMKGDIDSLNASVAAGVLGFEIARQRGI